LFLGATEKLDKQSKHFKHTAANSGMFYNTVLSDSCKKPCHLLAYAVHQGFLPLCTI